jgi:hypothetical protein
MAFPVPGQFISEAGEALWRAGCGHGYDSVQIFMGYDSVSKQNAAIIACPICTYVIQIIIPYAAISNVLQYPIIVS